ncbi:MAG: adenylate kinase [Candidatus Lokiarchaeota archaeon]|nr:adenylate kinase [Candidatus Lokiarchaeota archaeon]
MKKIILFGPPGAGKGTFSAQIRDVLPEIIHISTGDILRENLKGETPLGLKAKKYMDKGELVPDDVVIDMIKDRLKKKDVKKHGFVLDGFPRTYTQAEALNNITKIDYVVLLKVDEDIIIKRILGRYSCPDCGEIYNKYFMKPKIEGVCDECGASIKFEQRSDDNEETLRNRLNVYKENANPILEFYRKKGKVKEVNYENKLTEQEVKKVLEI